MHIKTTQKSQPFHKLISIEFICHGSILKNSGKAHKINDFMAGKGIYYTTTTPILFYGVG
ncbi:MAG: hypothetical protein E7244_12560 [Enterocloster citroniae]|nr:hypothetical protein [Enterocloster citroniae]